MKLIVKISKTTFYHILFICPISLVFIVKTLFVALEPS